MMDKTGVITRAFLCRLVHGSISLKMGGIVVWSEGLILVESFAKILKD